MFPFSHYLLRNNSFVVGHPIYKLNRKSMGCLDFPVWIGISIGLAVVFLVALIILANRKWEAIKFFMFMRFNVLVQDDEPENLNELEFDAFIAYRCVFYLQLTVSYLSNMFLHFCVVFCSHKDKDFMKEHVQRFLERDMGYTLCLHQRDFLAGESIPANIEAAIHHSRRMVMIISRFEMILCHLIFICVSTEKI